MEESPFPLAQQDSATNSGFTIEQFKEALANNDEAKLLSMFTASNASTLRASEVNPKDKRVVRDDD